MKKIFCNGLLACALMLSVSAVQAQTTNPNSAAHSWPPPDPAAVAHWQSLRFGMFIHWGPVSLTGHEIGWSRGAQTPVAVYDNLYHQFNPTNFNADEWVSIAKAAGMKYIVLTTKHHDGFCLWDTKLTDYNIMNSPFHRDVVKELAAACKKQGIEFGAYYSVTDWYNTNWPVTSPAGKVKRDQSDLDAYEKYLQGQITELIKNYGPLLTIWNDVSAMYGQRGAETIKLVRQLQPDILINNRTGDGGDYDTPEQKIGKFQMDRPWESCMTVSAHNAWAWGGANDGVKPLSACLEMLIRSAGGDGNILLNVGPRPDGVIDPAQANLLKEVGAWLAKNGESIYGTRGGPWKPTKSLTSTRKGNTVYLHVIKSEDGRVELPALPAQIKSTALLNGGKVECSQNDGKLSITIPPSALEPMDTIVKIEVDRPAMEIPVLTPASDIKATASNVFQGQNEEYGPQQAFDNDPQTRWATDSGTKQCWIAADLGKAATIQSIRISEAASYADRVAKFEFQYRAGGEWKTIFSGTKIGAKFQKKFEPVTAREFRLNILDATEGPTIAEIELGEK
jgi:alpha-L-fucosidase